MENNNPVQQTLLISFLTLRKTIGVLGIAMPFILCIGTLLIGHCHQIQNSISHYYYTNTGDVFVGILCAYSLFLIAYKGYDLQDNIVTSIAGVFALGVAFFPTTQNIDCDCSVLQLAPIPRRISVHYISAALFFLSLAYISFFLFTKGDNNPSPQKRIRNRIYKICAISMLLCLILIAIIQNVDSLSNLVTEYKLVFFLESIALFAFGISWLIKGEMILQDKV